MRGAAGEHQQAVHTEGDTGRVRQATLKRGEKGFIERHFRQAELRAFAVVGEETGALFAGVAELPEAVAQFQSIDIKLKAGGFAVNDAGKRRLRGRIIAEKFQRPSPGST